MLRRSLPLLVVLLVAGAVMAAEPQDSVEPRMVATPRAKVLAASATNRPFLAADRALQPVNLLARGYVETELAVSGYANVYDWAQGAAPARVAVRAADVPYTTRVLVRQPRDAARFSGRVIVELLNPTGLYDFAPLWGFSWDYFLRRGDVWVGVTVKPVAAATLKRFDSVRYAPLNFAFTQPAQCAAAPAAPGTDPRVNPPDAENGLAWDVIAQVGALLRSSSKENPLLLLNPRRLIAAGYSQTGGYITTYANIQHARLRLGDGQPVYDGYLNAAGANAAPINQCAAPLADDDPRRMALPRDVPFVTVMTESDFQRALARRRDDSDERGDVFRLYELAGAAHSGPFAAGQPGTADLTIAGFTAPAADACREPRSDFPLAYAFNAIWQQYDDFLVRQLPMERAPRIETDAGGEVLRDALGNARGGWRLPYSDVPLAVYTGRSTPRSDDARAQNLCALTGAMQRFDVPTLKARYGTRPEFLRRFGLAVDEAVTQRRLLPEDAVVMKQGAARTTPAF
jgi:hypothetical protein